MKLNWGRKTKTERHEEYPNKDAILLCTAIRVGKLNEYLDLLAKEPKKRIINNFLGIVCSKSSGLPIVGAETKPPVVVDGISLDPIQNIQARRMTKITLLLLVKDESKKLDMWDEIQPQWTDNYILENKALVQAMEVIAQQSENTGQESKVADIRKGIEDIKESNKEYAIDW